MASKGVKVLVLSIGIFLVAGGIFMLIYNMYTSQPLYKWIFATIVVIMVGTVALAQGIMLLSGRYD